jgi:hypothetical protein
MTASSFKLPAHTDLLLSLLSKAHVLDVGQDVLEALRTQLRVG